MNGKKRRNTMKKGIPKQLALVSLAFVFVIVILISVMAVPSGVDYYDSISNQTKSASSAAVVNISGGYISTFNLSTKIQDVRWKGFVGNVSGSFTLEDASGSTLYDWQLSTLTGRVYATRNGSTINWAGINCSNATSLAAEDLAMNLTNPDDNLTKTFSLTGNHPAFYVGSKFIGANSCPVLNTYVNNASQTSSFYEMALYTTPNLIYATVLEAGAVGYNGDIYDFQAIVPENGTPGFSGSTAYYLYIELGS